VSRDDDMRLLREALETTRLDSESRGAFNDMLHELKFGHRYCLSAAQRQWVVKALGEPTYENLVSRGLAPNVVSHNHKELMPCTASCPAWKPPTLANLPKRPPGGRP